jgi:hypothetical protein
MCNNPTTKQTKPKTKKPTQNNLKETVYQKTHNHKEKKTEFLSTDKKGDRLGRANKALLTYFYST